MIPRRKFLRRSIALLLVLVLAFVLGGVAVSRAAEYGVKGEDHSIRINLGGDGKSDVELSIPGGLRITMGGPAWLQWSELLIIVALGVWSLVWICLDANRRGKSSFWALVFAFAACWPLSLVWWLWLRPPRQYLAPPPIPNGPSPVP